MAKTQAQLNAESLERRGLDRLSLVVPIEDKARFARLRDHNNISATEMFTLLLDTYDKSQQPTGKSYAVQLLAANDGNIAASRSQLIRELQERYSSDWRPDCSAHKRGTPHYAAQRIYNGVVKHLR